MTESSEFELLELATPYALDAVSENERAAIETHIAAAPAAVAASFDDEVRLVRETMAVVSASTPVEPPAALRGRLASVSPGLGTLIRLAHSSLRGSSRDCHRARRAERRIGVTLHSATVDPGAVLAADDVRTVSGAMPAGGTATVVYSREKNAGVLVMNNVPPPSSGTVCQMWLMGDNGAKLAGTMDAKAVAPPTTAVIREISREI